MTPLLINIVYTPGTVAYLLPFAQSLLDHSDATFRLVDNGCLPPERRLLDAFAGRQPRAKIWSMPGDDCRPHSEVLDRLRLLPHPGPYCFLDSDIVASGPFAEQLVAALDTAGAVFSGAPVWLRDEDAVFRRGYRSMTGELIRDERGRCLGCTYVAAYASAPLAEAAARFGVGFGEYAWHDLSPAAQARLAERDCRAERYDTGRVLTNLIAGEAVYLPLTNLHHLGGFSFPALDGSAGARPVRHPWLPRALRRLIAIWNYQRFGGIGEATAIARRRLQFRDPVRRHFWTLSHALLSGGQPAPPPRTGDADVDRRIDAASAAIRHCYAAYAAAETLHRKAVRG